MKILEKESFKQINKLILSMVAGNLGSGILTFVIGLLILQETDSAINFGFSQIIGPVVSFLLLPVKGSIVDKFQKKRVLFFSQLLSLAALVFYAAVIQLNGFSNLFYTYLLLIILEISDQFLSVTFNASIKNIVLDQHVQKVQSLKQVSGALTMVFIPVIAVLLTARISLITLLIIEIIIEIIAVTIILTINFNLVKNTEFTDGVSETSSTIGLFKEGIRFVRQYKKIVFALFFAMLINFIFGAINVGLPFLQVSVFEFSNLVYGFSEAAFALGMIITGIYLSSKSNIKWPLYTSTKMIGIIGILFTCLGICLSFNLESTYFIPIIMGFNLSLGILMTRTNVPITTWLIKEIPESYQGRVFNLMNAGGELLTPLGILVFSYLFDHFSSHAIFIIAGLLVILTVVVYPLATKIELKSSTLE